MIAKLAHSLLLAACFVKSAVAVAATDTYRDSDIMQSSYYNNHNMDPAVVDSASFGLLWKQGFETKEQFYAKPLVFTPAGQDQLVFLASQKNNIRTINAKTGALINSRLVSPPFLQSDLNGCTDIPNWIGIIGTPVIDPNTEIAYFYAKTYIPNYRVAGNTGTFNGVYYFYAVDIKTLADISGFPILVDGTPADNDPRKYFVGGTILQRPSLLQVGNYVYAGFGGHCDMYNYTGIILGIDIVNKKVVTNYAVESGPNSKFTLDWTNNGGGGMGGVWQSGMGLSSDGNSRLFFATGNGAGGENQGQPASGASGCRTLGEAVINLAIDKSTGKLSQLDYFQPYDYVNMDGGDRDFGAGGVALLDPTVFKGNGVSQIAVTSGKNGKIYFMNANNLGGYKQGSGQTDGVLQSIATNEAVFGGVGSYPLEGGYVYSTPVGYPTIAYKLGFTTNGVPYFTKAGQTNETSAGRVGPGIPTITTYKGQAGTAIMWTTDPDAGLRAWYAVPGADGYLKRIQLPQTGGNNKFQRPVFGDTRMYVSDGNGNVYCMGSPVNLPLNCSSPVQFGTVLLGQKKNATVQCSALVAITSISSVTVSDLNFKVDQSTVPTGALAKGASFSLSVTWDLTNVTVSNAVNASFGNTSPGIKSAALTIGTVNAVAGYTTAFPISLTGTQQSSKAYLDLTPPNVDFGGLVLGTTDGVPSSTLAFTVSNLGSKPMTILGYAYTTDEVDDTDIDFTNATQGADGTWDLGNGFTATALPAIGQVMAPGESASVPATFSVNTTGSYLSYFFIWADGGKKYTILDGSASSQPKANFSISTSEGGWLPQSNLIMDFGSVMPGNTASRQIRICNEGGSVLTITKSKPPLGDLRVQNYGIDLHESQQIPVDQCAYGTVLFNPSAQPVNILDFSLNTTWTLNTDDTSFGVHEVFITGVVHDKYVGPLKADGTPRYQYLGCYKDQATRILPKNQYTDSTGNENGKCQTAAAANNYIFAGTQYAQECWLGNSLPNATYYTKESDGKCVWSCPGDVNQTCGGVGGYESIYYDSTKYTVTNLTYDPNAPVIETGPYTVKSIGAYSYMGCYTEVGARALTGKNIGAPAAGGSVEYCASKCAGYTYFGVEYANECYCGNSINSGSTLTTSGCNMVCGGNSSEYCGGASRLNMYGLASLLSSSSSSQVQSSTTTTSSISSTAISSTTTSASSSVVSSSTTLSSGSTISTSSTLSSSIATTTTTTTTTSAVASQTPLSCPASNNTIWTSSSGATFLIECSIDHAGGDMGSKTVSTLEQCLEYCASTTGCVDVSLSGVACYIKKTLGAASKNAGLLGAKLVVLPASSSTTVSTTTTSSSAIFSSVTSNVGIISSTTSALSSSSFTSSFSSSSVSSAFTSPVTSTTQSTASGTSSGISSSTTSSSGISSTTTTTTATTPSTTSGSSSSTTSSSDAPSATITSSATSSSSSATTSDQGTSSTTQQSSTTSTTSDSSTTSSSYSSSSSSSSFISSSTTDAPTTTSTTSSTSSSSLTSTSQTSSANTTQSTTLQTSSSSTTQSTTSQTTSQTSVSTTSVASSTTTTVASSSSTTQSSSSLSSTTQSSSLTSSSTQSSSLSTTTTSASPASSTLSSTTASSTTASSTTQSATTPATTTTTSKPSTTLATSTTTTSIKPFAPAIIGNYTYQGCYNDTTASRALKSSQLYGTTSNPMTLEKCATFCAKYAIWGVEYGQECYCADVLSNNSKNGTATDCKTACPGNSTELCGAGNRLQLYSKVASSSSTSATPASTPVKLRFRGMSN